MLPLIGLIPLLPLAGFLVCGLLERRLPKPAVTIVACGSVLLAFLVSAGAVLELRTLPAPGAEPGLGGPVYQKTYWTWLPPMPLERDIWTETAPVARGGSRIIPVARELTPGSGNARAGNARAVSAAVASAGRPYPPNRHVDPTRRE